MQCLATVALDFGSSVFSIFLYLISLVWEIIIDPPMTNERKTANAVGGKTARACESCVRKRARWYCAADDAFLCQSCDASVHSANQLAGRHERVRLETASFKVFASGSSEPAWHQGFTRKARTPRLRPKSLLKEEGKKSVNLSIPLVPEIGIEESSSLDDGEEEQLLYRVPVYDPFAAELRNASNEMERSETLMVEKNQEEACKLDDLQGFDLPTDDLELLEFAADVESLLGKGSDEDSRGIEGLGLGLTKDCKEEEHRNIGSCFEENRVKVEDEVEAILGYNLDPSKEVLDWDFDYESEMMIREEEEEQKVVVGEGDEPMMMMMESTTQCKEEEMMRRPTILLRLNHEEVINAWADQGSPWTTGTRPEFNPGNCWPDFMGIGSGGADTSYVGARVISDGAREARVSRYREKRRTRLFSKKIRYEVRKLNAEKRPRMKGRFVKRTSVGSLPPATSNFPPNYLIKK